MRRANSWLNMFTISHIQDLTVDEKREKRRRKKERRQRESEERRRQEEEEKPRLEIEERERKREKKERKKKEKEEQRRLEEEQAEKERRKQKRKKAEQKKRKNEKKERKRREREQRRLEEKEKKHANEESANGGEMEEGESDGTVVEQSEPRIDELEEETREDPEEESNVQSHLAAHKENSSKDSEKGQGKGKELVGEKKLSSSEASAAVSRLVRRLKFKKCKRKRCGSMINVTMRKDLLYHASTHFDGPALFSCRQCSYNSNRECNMRSHIRIRHPLADVSHSFNDTTFRNHTRTLDRLILSCFGGAVESEQTNAVGYKCKLCGEMTRDRGRHSLSHLTSSIIFECPECNQRYNRKDSLLLHIRNCTSDSTVLDRRNISEVAVELETVRRQCFPDLEKLVGTGDWEADHTCKVCNVMTSQCVSHINSHLPSPMRFRCSNCRRLFNDKSNLNTHLKSCTGGKLIDRTGKKKVARIVRQTLIKCFPHYAQKTGVEEDEKPRFADEKSTADGEEQMEQEEGEQEKEDGEQEEEKGRNKVLWSQEVHASDGSGEESEEKTDESATPHCVKHEPAID